MEDVNKYLNFIEIESENEKFLNEQSFHYFHEDTREAYFRKILSNRWELIVDWSINIGNSHFAITINMPNAHDFGWYDYDTFCGENYKNMESKLTEIFIQFFPTLTYFFIVAEKNKKGKLHLHILLAIRNFIDYNYVLRQNVTNVLKDNFDTIGLDMCDYDIKVESLRYFKDIKNWAIYMYKDMYNWRYQAKIYVLENHKQTPIIDNLGNVTWFYLQIICEIVGFENKLEDKLNYINGIMLRENIINQRTLIDIILYYLILSDSYIYNDSIYKKIQGSKISFKRLGTITEVLYDNFQENIVLFFTNNYKHYFEGFDFSYLLETHFVKTKKIINEIRDLSTQRLKPDFSLIEFSDGIYSIKYDRFFPHTSLKYKFSNKVSTIKYYSKPYEVVRKTKPKKWIKSLLNSLGVQTKGYENDLNFNLICLYLCNVLHKDLLNKKKTLHVWGESNTGKTTLIVDILVNYFGKENVGTIIGTNNFKFQDLEGKLIGVLDEFKYSPSDSSELLKLTGGELLTTSKKYSKDHIKIDSIPIFALGNNEIKDQNKNINEALISRITSIEFINKLKETEGLREKLKLEEANIIVYINKLLFKLKKSGAIGKYEDIGRPGRRISNQRVMEMIENKIK